MCFSVSPLVPFYSSDTQADAVMTVSDLTKQLATCTPPIPQVRINEVLLALVRAKVATKGLVKV